MIDFRVRVTEITTVSLIIMKHKLLCLWWLDLNWLLHEQRILVLYMSRNHTFKTCKCNFCISYEEAEKRQLLIYIFLQHYQSATMDILFLLTNLQMFLCIHVKQRITSHTSSAPFCVFIRPDSSNVSMSSRPPLRFLGNLWAALTQNPSLSLEPHAHTDTNTPQVKSTCFSQHTLSTVFTFIWRVLVCVCVFVYLLSENHLIWKLPLSPCLDTEIGRFQYTTANTDLTPIRSWFQSFHFNIVIVV